MFRVLTKALVCLGAAALVGCASTATGPKFAEMGAALPAVKEGMGRVVLYRPSSMVGMAIRPQIRLDGVVVGKSEPGVFFYADTLAGKHAVSTETETESTLPIDVAAGRTQYVRMTIAMGVLVGRVAFAAVPEDVARGELSELKYSGTAAIPSGAVPAVAAVAPAATAAVQAGTPAAASGMAAGRSEEYEYKITDLFTRMSRNVVFRVDRVEGERMIINQNARVETRAGEVLSIQSALAGDMDKFTPPGGFGRTAAGEAGTSSRLRFRSLTSNNNEAVTVRLDASVQGRSTLNTPMGPLEVVNIRYTGWADFNRGPNIYPAQVKLRVAYSPQLRRVVRFESDVQRASDTGGAAVNVSSKEVIDLVAVRKP